MSVSAEDREKAAPEWPAGHYQDVAGRHWLHQVYDGSAYGAPERDTDQWLDPEGKVATPPETLVRLIPAGPGGDPIPRYAQLDIWQALGREPAAFETWRDRVGFAEAWAQLYGSVRGLAGGVSARPDRETLARELAKVDGHPFAHWDLSVWPPVETDYLAHADALLAVEHLWTPPATGVESRTDEEARTEFRNAYTAELERARAKGYTEEHDHEHGPQHLLDWATEYLYRGEPVKAAGLIAAARALLACDVVEHGHSVPSVPVVDPKALREVVADALITYEGFAMTTAVGLIVERIGASGVVVDRATVERELRCPSISPSDQPCIGMSEPWHEVHADGIGSTWRDYESSVRREGRR